jgi:hypothetical protein
MLSSRARCFRSIEHRHLPGRDNVAWPEDECAGLIGIVWPLTSRSSKIAGGAGGRLSF